MPVTKLGPMPFQNQEFSAIFESDLTKEYVLIKFILGFSSFSSAVYVRWHVQWRSWHSNIVGILNSECEQN